MLGRKEAIMYRIDASIELVLTAGSVKICCDVSYGFLKHIIEEWKWIALFEACWVVRGLKNAKLVVIVLYSLCV